MVMKLQGGCPGGAGSRGSWHAVFFMIVIKHAIRTAEVTQWNSSFRKPWQSGPTLRMHGVVMNLQGGCPAGGGAAGHAVVGVVML